MANKFQKKPAKLFNSYAAAYNEPTICFPDSDTLGGAAVLKDNGNFTMQVKEPVYDLQMIKDPIISEVLIVPMKYGGGIVNGIIGNSEIDTDMNPVEPIIPKIPQPPATAEINAEKRKKNIIIVVIAILLLVGIVFLMRKK